MIYASCHITHTYKYGEVYIKNLHTQLFKTYIHYSKQSYMSSIMAITITTKSIAQLRVIDPKRNCIHCKSLTEKPIRLSRSTRSKHTNQILKKCYRERERETLLKWCNLRKQAALLLWRAIFWGLVLAIARASVQNPKASSYRPSLYIWWALSILFIGAAIQHQSNPLILLYSVINKISIPRACQSPWFQCRV